MATYDGSNLPLILRIFAWVIVIASIGSGGVVLSEFSQNIIGLTAGLALAIQGIFVFVLLFSIAKMYEKTDTVEYDVSRILEKTKALEKEIKSTRKAG